MNGMVIAHHLNATGHKLFTLNYLKHLYNMSHYKYYSLCDVDDFTTAMPAFPT